MRIGFMLAGLLFFLNPNILVVDILPDFIGAILILYGLSHAAEIDERIRVTRKTLYTLLFVSLGRFMCTFLAPIIDPKEYTWFLVFAFCFGLGEAYLFCRSMWMLDSGLTYLSLQSNHNDIYQNTGGTSLGMTIVFTSVKTVFSILPALTYLVTDYGTVTEVQTNWTFVMWMLMAVNVLLVTVYGILWYIRMVRFWKPLKKSDFLAHVEERYEKEYLANRSLTVYRDLHRVSLLLTLGCLFAIPVRMDGIDILPDVVAGVLFIFAARFLRRMYEDAAKSTAVLAALYTAVSLGEWVVMVWFSKSNFTVALIEQGAAFGDWMGYLVFRYSHHLVTFGVYCILAAIKLVIVFLLILSLRRAMRCMIAEHTGSIDEVGSSTEKTAQVRAYLGRLMNVVIVVSALASVFSIATTVLFFWMPILPTFDLAIWGAFAVLLYCFTDKLKACIDDRYYYDT